MAKGMGMGQFGGKRTADGSLNITGPRVPVDKVKAQCQIARVHIEPNLQGLDPSEPFTAKFLQKF